MNSTLAEQMLKVQIADALRWEEARIVASQAPLMHPMLYLPPPGKFKPEECRWMRVALLGRGTFYATPGDGYPASVVPLPEQGELFVPLIPVTVAVQMLMRDFEAMKRPSVVADELMHHVQKHMDRFFVESCSRAFPVVTPAPQYLGASWMSRAITTGTVHLEGRPFKVLTSGQSYTDLRRASLQGAPYPSDMMLGAPAPQLLLGGAEMDDKDLLAIKPTETALSRLLITPSQTHREDSLGGTEEDEAPLAPRTHLSVNFFCGMLLHSADGFWFRLPTTLRLSNYLKAP